MVNKYYRAKLLAITIAMNVANFTISNFVETFAELNFQAKNSALYLQTHIICAGFIGIGDSSSYFDRSFMLSPHSTSNYY